MGGPMIESRWGEITRTCSERPKVHPASYTLVTESFPGFKLTGHGVHHPPTFSAEVNSLNAELNPICHLLALLEAHHILHVRGKMVKEREKLHF